MALIIYDFPPRYMRSPMSREPGFCMTMMATMVSTVGAVYCTFMYNQTPFIGYSTLASYIGINIRLWIEGLFGF